MKRWNPDGWTSMMSVAVELGAADWSSRSVERWTVFGEWMVLSTGASSGAEAGGASMFRAG